MKSGTVRCLVGTVWYSSKFTETTSNKICANKICTILIVDRTASIEYWIEFNPMSIRSGKTTLNQEYAYSCILKTGYRSIYNWVVYFWRTIFHIWIVNSMNWLIHDSQLASCISKKISTTDKNSDYVYVQTTTIPLIIEM